MQMTYFDKTIPKRLCILMPTFFYERVGGVEIQTYLIAKYLAARNWEVHFIAGTKSAKKINSVELCEGFRLHWVEQAGFLPFSRKDIILLLRKINPSIIYQRGRSPFTSSPTAYRFARTAPVKTVYHCAENNDLTKSFNVTEVRNSGKNTLKKTVLFFRAFLYDHFFRRTILHSDIIIVQTQEQADLFRDTFDLPTTVIPSSHEVPSDIPLKSQPPIVFWIAHAGRRKRLEIFVELARRLQSESICFVFAGTLPHADYRNEIFSSMSGLKNIEYIGPLSWKESNTMFAKASVFVNTTMPGREGFPNTYIQAWLHGTPVVTLDCDPDNVIKENNLGFHSGSLDKMAEDVLSIIRNKELRDTIGTKARAYALEHHNIEKTSSDMAMLFSNLLTSV